MCIPNHILRCLSIVIELRTFGKSKVKPENNSKLFRVINPEWVFHLLIQVIVCYINRRAETKAIFLCKRHLHAHWHQKHNRDMLHVPYTHQNVCPNCSLYCDRPSITISLEVQKVYRRYWSKITLLSLTYYQMCIEHSCQLEQLVAACTKVKCFRALLRR